MVGTWQFSRARVLGILEGRWETSQTLGSKSAPAFLKLSFPPDTWRDFGDRVGTPQSHELQGRCL